jgi:hypothetical protein
MLAEETRGALIRRIIREATSIGAGASVEMWATNYIQYAQLVSDWKCVKIMNKKNVGGTKGRST